MLFIGGHADGKWIDVHPEMRTFEVPIIEPEEGRYCIPSDIEIAAKIYKKELYKKETLMGWDSNGNNRIEHTVMFLYRETDLIGKLIEGYKKP